MRVRKRDPISPRSTRATYPAHVCARSEGLRAHATCAPYRRSRQPARSPSSQSAESANRRRHEVDAPARGHPMVGRPISSTPTSAGNVSFMPASISGVPVVVNDQHAATRRRARSGRRHRGRLGGGHAPGQSHGEGAALPVTSAGDRHGTLVQFHQRRSPRPGQVPGHLADARWTAPPGKSGRRCVAAAWRPSNSRTDELWRTMSTSSHQRSRTRMVDWSCATSWHR